MENFEPRNDTPELPPNPVVSDIPPSLENPPVAEGENILPTQSEAWANFRQFMLDLIETLLLAIILYFGINALSARVRVDGFSMNPTLQDGEYVLVSKVSYQLGVPQRGDIIVFKFPGPSEQDLIKRIVGLPGDIVEVRDGQVYVNGSGLEEPYINARPLYNGIWQVPEGELFVLGDNRNDSSDSHSWGMLPQANVIGKAILIYWPPPEWNMINHFEIKLTQAGATQPP